MTATLAAALPSVLGASSSSGKTQQTTSGDAKGGTNGSFSFGNVNFSGTQSNSAGVNWLLAGGIAVCALGAIYLLKD